MREIILGWYYVVSSLSAPLVEPVSTLERSINVPLVSALLFGLLGALSPCQLTTNASALAYVARGAGDRRTVAAGAVAYLFGKALVYTAIGVAAVLLGQQLSQVSVPVITSARKALGPLMLLLGLSLLGIVRTRISFGHGIASRLEARAGSGAAGAFLLGTAFAFAFCPTLALLFFTYTIPLALASPLGVTFPGVFALGTTLPLLGLAALLVAGVAATQGYLAGARRVETWLRPAAAAVLLLAGVHDTITYWLL